ncbi:MAG: heavy metal-responsive transcriptional regulator [Planctomycetaceae bacterium]|nr:heavy metal-responsive transcriptional regulator [Planctomycetaceae bacterium]
MLRYHELMDTYTIGKLAKAADVPTSTLRYYERIGLLTAEHRSHSSYRLYGPASLNRLRFIKAAQSCGFTLDDVAHLLNLRVKPSGTCNEVQELMEHRLKDIGQRMAELNQVREVLEAFLKDCKKSRRRSQCAVVVHLDHCACQAGSQ